MPDVQNPTVEEVIPPSSDEAAAPERPLLPRMAHGLGRAVRIVQDGCTAAWQVTSHGVAQLAEQISSAASKPEVAETEAEATPAPAGEAAIVEQTTEAAPAAEPVVAQTSPDQPTPLKPQITDVVTTDISAKMAAASKAEVEEATAITADGETSKPRAKRAKQEQA